MLLEHKTYGCGTLRNSCKGNPLALERKTVGTKKIKQHIYANAIKPLHSNLKA